MAKYNSLTAYQKKLDYWMKKNPKNIRKALTRGANLVRREVITKHLGQPATSKRTGREEKNATLRNRTGRLINSIGTHVKNDAKGARARIGSGVGKKPVQYAPYHEEGSPLRKIPARPYLKPSLEAKRDQALQEILNVLIKSYRRS